MFPNVPTSLEFLNFGSYCNGLQTFSIEIQVVVHILRFAGYVA